MERIAFLVEGTGVRLGCLLNPDTLVMRRTAGIHPRAPQGRPLTGAMLSDDPLVFSGGGVTELTLDLLFDVSLAGSTIASSDVRDLTRPLWDLAENAPGPDGYGRPPLVRFVWGKSWNIPGVVASVAERLEFFAPEGAPRRSWLRMRILRVNDNATANRPVRPLRSPVAARVSRSPADRTPPPERGRVHTTTTAGQSTVRLDDIAQQEYGDPSRWRAIAALNDIDDPMHVPGGKVLRLPD